MNRRRLPLRTFPCRRRPPQGPGHINVSATDNCSAEPSLDLRSHSGKLVPHRRDNGHLCCGGRRRQLGHEQLHRHGEGRSGTDPDLIALVQSFSLSPGTANSLLVKLQAAQGGIEPWKCQCNLRQSQALHPRSRGPGGKEADYGGTGQPADPRSDTHRSGTRLPFSWALIDRHPGNPTRNRRKWQGYIVASRALSSLVAPAANQLRQQTQRAKGSCLTVAGVSAEQPTGAFIRFCH